jgi:integrase
MGAIHRLSQKYLTTAEDGLHADGGNLYFCRRTSAKGSVATSWVFRYFSRVHHKTFDLGLGKWPEVSLDKARKRAFEYRVKLADGVDVAAEHKKARHDMLIAAAPVVTPIGYTFERCAREFIASQEAGWGRLSSEQWTHSLQNYVFPVIGNTAIDRVDTEHVLKALKPIWEAKHDTASKIRGRIERILDWAKAKKLRNGGENCARWKGHMEHLLANNVKRVEHHQAVAVEDIPAFMAKVRACPRVSARALELLCLTATRSDEIRGAKFGEVDTKVKVWIIPAARTKTGKKSGEPHIVPLSDRAVAIIEEQRRNAGAEDYIFRGERSGVQMGVNEMSRRMAEISGRGPVPHGLRSSFRDWCGENGYPRDLAELSLAHVVGSAVERSYRRSALVEQRRKIMDAWAAYCGQA